MAQNKSMAVMQNRVSGPDSLDLYPTPPWATRALCEWIEDQGYGCKLLTAWEPACGLGHMSRVLAEYFEDVRSSDIHDYGHGAVANFLLAGREETAHWIITNPPFNHAEDFIDRAVPRARQGVAMLVRTSFLEGVGRFNRLFKMSPPSDVLQFVERVPMHKGRLLEKGSTATSYCWLVFRKSDLKTQTRFDWIAPCRKRLERAGDYA